LLLFAAGLLLTGRHRLSGQRRHREGVTLIGIVQRGPELITCCAFGPEAGSIGVAASPVGICSCAP
jgi:hypothetical protein